MIVRFLLAFVLATSAWPAMAAGPLQVTSRILVERRVTASDGTTQVKTVPASRATPGDGLTFELAYRNTGKAPIADLVLANPVPGHIAYRAAAQGSPTPEVSVDGEHYGALASLQKSLPGGGVRAAGPDDVVAVRWRLTKPVAAGAGGTLAFRGVLK
jgi:uncharacterized repeat protein (TIGR01451 family)